MFHPSPQHVFLTQQVITLNQSYPCPRCTSGMMEPYGLTETFQCTSCKRAFVPLKGGRYLYPARSIGWRIAPTFWWDGFRWHWAGTTATTRQLTIIVLLSLLPVLAVNLTICLNLWANRPDWCNPALMTPLIGLLTIQFIYLLCWDFDFLSKHDT
jgi:hypothetical protein